MAAFESAGPKCGQENYLFSTALCYQRLSTVSVLG